MSMLNFLLVAIILLNPFSNLKAMDQEVKDITLNQPYKVGYSLNIENVENGASEKSSLDVLGNVILSEDISKSYMDLDIGFDSDEYESIDLGVLLKDNNLYVEKDNVWHLSNINSNIFEAYSKDLLKQSINDVYYTKNLTDSQYFKFYEIPELNMTKVDNIKESLYKIEELFKNSFLNDNSFNIRKHIKSDANQIIIHLDSEEQKELFLNVLEKMKNNKDDSRIFIRSVLNVISNNGTLNKLLNLNEINDVQLNLLTDKLLKEVDDYYLKYKTDFDNLNEEKSYLDIVYNVKEDGFSLEFNMYSYKDEKNYSSVKSVLNMNNAYFDMVELDFETLNQKTFLDDLSADYKRKDPNHNLIVSWDRTNPYLTANAFFTRNNNGEYRTVNNTTINYFLNKGSLYLPLRYIAEGFGEVVGWDSVSNQSYVYKDGQFFYLEGKVINGKTYIKIRDFEQFGYAVDYKSELINNVNIESVHIYKK